MNRIATKKTPWRHDPRSKRFSHAHFFGTIKPVWLLDTLGRTRRPVENQKDTLRCTGYGTAVAGGYMHGIRFHPDWQAAKIGQIQGVSVDVNGGDPNDAMRSEMQYGFLPITATTLTLQNNTIENTGWHSFDASLDALAIDNHTAGFVSVDGANDVFDNIRSALQMAYMPGTGLGAPVQAFGKWHDDWTNARFGMIPQQYDATQFSYHHWLFVDFETLYGTPYLVAHLSSGTLIGDQGFFYFPREVVNKEFADAGTRFSGVSLKIGKPLSAEQIALAKQPDAWGDLERLILKAWYAVSEAYINRSGRLKKV